MNNSRLPQLSVIDLDFGCFYLIGYGCCPYAKGASGNVSTEDVFYMMQFVVRSMGMATIYVSNGYLLAQWSGRVLHSNILAKFSQR